MNAHSNVVALTDRGDAGERKSPIDHDAPIGLPGETAPDAQLEEGKERDEGEPRKRRVNSNLEALLASFRAGVTRKKTVKTDEEGADSPSARPGVVESGGVLRTCAIRRQGSRRPRQGRSDERG